MVSSMVRTAAAETLGADVYAQLREAVLAGRYQPGQRLVPAELAAEYNVSPGVLREALTRLAEQQLATLEPNRGYRVISIDAKQIEDLVELRRVTEEAALRKSIECGDAAWESHVIAALHRLKAARQGDNRLERSQAHHDFHMTLLSACGNQRLFELCDANFRASELYRYWSAEPQRSSSTAQRRDEDSEHEDIERAVLARDVDLAVSLYDAHLLRTAALAVEFSRRRESA